MEIIYFKWCHKTYYGQTVNGTVLLWAKCTQTYKSHFLGCFKDNKVIETENYMNLEWDVKKGADRLYKIVLEKYWCRDFKKTKDISTSLLTVGSYDSITNYDKY